MAPFASVLTFERLGFGWHSNLIDPTSCFDATLSRLAQFTQSARATLHVQLPLGSPSPKGVKFERRLTPMRSISHAILLSPLFPQTAKRSIVPPWGLSCWLRVALKPTTRARLVGMRVDGLLTGRAWLRRAAWSVERLASEPGGLVPTTVTGPPPIPFRAGTFSRRVSCCEARLRCLSTERHCRRSCA